jgi:MFS superfamily sulfate permease-like transporter
MAFEIAIISTLVVIGNIFMGHFEEMTPKWKKLLKFIIYTTLLCLISYFFGRMWFYISFGILFSFVIFIHAWWLPKKGINGWTGEPKEKYYKLRGWKKI